MIGKGFPMRYIISLVLASLALPAWAEVPKVVTDIPPVHALVAQVMGDLGTPDLLLERGASEHDFQLRPSQAAGLADAGLVVWIGPELTPWLDRALEGLGEGAKQLPLLAVPGTVTHAYAEGGAHMEAGHDDHGHDDHAEEAAGHDDHDHSGTDPHAWLDPANAKLWLGAIAQDLSDLDPDNAATYAANAAAAAGWTLMLLSFAYGVFHAAGPGHGKAVISTWLLATESELKRGVLISFMSAIIQALTAIVLVSVLFLVVASAGASARNMAGVLESASYGLIALLGAYLMWTALALLRPAKAPAAVPAGVTERRSTGLSDFGSFQPMKGAAPTQAHVHGPDCGCGHAHLPAAQELRGEWSFAKAFSLAFAVGIRPCTGAILVLIFANGLGLYWAGVASTLAMALGTFITVSAIAAIAVYFRKLAARFTRGQSRLGEWMGIGLRFGGGVVILFLGTILFLGSLGGTNAMM